MAHRPFASAPYVVGKSAPAPAETHIPAEESLCPVVSHDWINSEYKHLVVDASPKALAVKPGQFFNLLCPSPDAAELWLRRPQSVYRIDRENRRIEFLYKCVGRGTFGLATLAPGDELNMVGPLGVGFTIDRAWKHIVVLGRGVGLATLAPISQLAGECGIGVTAILSARSAEFVMVPGQVAMEQVMACGLGPCYVCVRTFEVHGKKELRRVCIDGPVFDLQEAVGW